MIDAETAIIALVILGPIVVYMIARLIFTAYFNTKKQFNKQRSRRDGQEEKK